MIEKELYIFSNDPVPPIRKMEVGMTHSDYLDLSSYLDPKVAVAPSYDTPKGYPVKNLDEHKENHPNFDFILVFELSDSEIVEGNEVFTYKYSHKEFNLKGKREKA